MKAYTHFCAHLSRKSLSADAEHIVRQIYVVRIITEEEWRGHIYEHMQPNEQM